jgi:hypothetical protein
MKIVCVLAKINCMITYSSHDEPVFIFIPIYPSYLVQCRNNIGTQNYLTYFGPKRQSKHLAKHLRYFARYLSSKYLR